MISTPKHAEVGWCHYCVSEKLVIPSELQDDVPILHYNADDVKTDIELESKGVHKGVFRG